MITAIKRAISNPSPISLKTVDALKYLGGVPARSGMRVSASTALSYAPVWQAVSQISGDVSEMPIGLFRREINNGLKTRTQIYDHDMARLVMRPHARLNWQKFWRRYMVQALIYNRGYIWLERDRLGTAKSMMVLRSGATEWDEEHQIYVTRLLDGTRVGLFPSEVLEIEGIQYGDANECALVRLFKESVGLGLAAEGHNASFFGKGGSPSGVLMIPPHMTPKAADKIQNTFVEKYNNANAWFTTIVARDGAKWERIAATAEESQMHDVRIDQVYDMARWWNMPPSRLGMPDATSYNEKSEDNQNYLDMTLSIWLTGLCAELWFKLLTEEEQRDHFFAHDVTSLLALNPKSRAETNRIRVEMGEINPNEARAENGLPPREGGDTYRMGSGVMIEGEKKEPELPPIPPQEPDDEPVDEPDDRSLSAALTNLNRVMVHRIGRVISEIRMELRRKSATQFCSWWDANIERLRQPDDLPPAVELFELAGGTAIQFGNNGNGFDLFDEINRALEITKVHELAERITMICRQFEGIDFTNTLKG